MVVPLHTEQQAEAAGHGYWFALGKKVGRDEARAEIMRALGIDEAISKAIASHEDQLHE